jgi:hypothetical protein
MDICVRSLCHDFDAMRTDHFHSLISNLGNLLILYNLLIINNLFSRKEKSISRLSKRILKLINLLKTFYNNNNNNNYDLLQASPSKNIFTRNVEYESRRRRHQSICYQSTDLQSAITTNLFSQYRSIDRSVPRYDTIVMVFLPFSTLSFPFSVSNLTMNVLMSLEADPALKLLRVKNNKNRAWRRVRSKDDYSAYLLTYLLFYILARGKTMIVALPT